MDWTEYADATSHAAIWIGLTADGLAAEVVEMIDGWRWQVREIGAEGRGVIAHGRHPTADGARCKAEWAARGERCAACGAPMEPVEMTDGTVEHVCASWSCPARLSGEAHMTRDEYHAWRDGLSSEWQTLADESCPTCGGSGWATYTDESDHCPDCGGDGMGESAGAWGRNYACTRRYVESQMREQGAWA